MIDVQLLAVECDVRLRLDGGGDIGSGDRAEQTPLGAGLDGNRERLGDQGGSNGLRALTVLRIAQVTSAAHGNSLRRGTIGGLQGVALGQQEVASKAVGHLDDIAALAETLAVRTKDQLHQPSTSVPSNVASPATSSSDSASASTLSTAAAAT